MPMTVDDLTVTNGFRAGSMSLPADSIGNTEVSSVDPIEDSKLYHRYKVLYNTDAGAAVTAKNRIAHIADQAGMILGLRVTLGVKCTGTTSYVKVDIWKNNVKVTSVAAKHGPTHTAFVPGDDGTFSSSTYIAGDVLEFRVTVAAGDGAVGEQLCAILTLSELP